MRLVMDFLVAGELQEQKRRGTEEKGNKKKASRCG